MTFEVKFNLGGKGIVLWDIDGTLIKLNNSRFNKHLLAVNKILKLNIKYNANSAGKTDLQIIHEIIGVDYKTIPSHKKNQMIKYLDHLTKIELQFNPVILNINIKETLEIVRAHGWINGILTGNTLNRIKYKLESAKLTNCFNDEFIFNGESDENRIELVRSSQSIIMKKKFFKLLIIGDSPADIIAAKLSNIPIMAVATGNHTNLQLQKYKPDALLRNFQDDFTKFIDFIDTL